MRRLIHLSDLHFGRTRPDLLEPLIRTVNDLRPDHVVVSGDFTQRARVTQYREAAAFLDRLDPPWLAVPGNHDTPLDNLWLRLLNPWGRYRRHIARDLEPLHVDPEIVIKGINTVNRFAWQAGRMSRRTVRRLCRVFDGSDAIPIQVAVMHHPLEHLQETQKRLMRGARRAVAELGQCGADIVLSGHLHNANVSPMTAEPGILFVQAGTGLSTRVRGEPNTFNVLDIDDGRVAVRRYAAAEDPVFAIEETQIFERAGGVWRQST